MWVFSRGNGLKIFWIPQFVVASKSGSKLAPKYG
jgi:hypothetical protein